MGAERQPQRQGMHIGGENRSWSVVVNAKGGKPVDGCVAALRMWDKQLLRTLKEAYQERKYIGNWVENGIRVAVATANGSCTHAENESRKAELQMLTETYCERKYKSIGSRVENTSRTVVAIQHQHISDKNGSTTVVAIKTRS